MADDAEVEQAAVAAGDGAQPPALSKSARKKLQKQERQAERKAARKAAEKERRRADVDRRRREWEEALAAAPSDEARAEMVAARRETRRERVGRRAEERGARAERLRRAAEGAGQKVVLDLEFADLMRPNEIHSLTQQIMYCYAVNGRSANPAHLWLTGCSGEMATHLQRIPGYDKWIIEKAAKPYLEAFEDRKENLVYLTADAETVLDDLDMSKIYIIGGLVDRNRWKGVTLKKAAEQGIQSAKLPIGNYLKMSSSQVLTVNQVFEIMLKFVETRDWKTAFFHVIPQRKRGEAEAGDDEAKVSLEDNDDAAEGAGDGNLSEEYLEKLSHDEVDDDGDEELEDEETDMSNKRQCVRRQDAGPGDQDHSGAVAEATPAGDATPQAEQAKESNDGVED
ncbi:tRNA (guanine(9)-N1)-methyltransferase [Panicum miliaceum]|uniref:tRNA (guanine(9)-N(1))-methyltransferase n=1 Tax=Panicum miliaceum TaxID=4540 RepID=A0A3L6RW71_PANMI|nr:tRNA (guanine(9)-N1)-methyltransferase [Panicum miliaceum]